MFDAAGSWRERYTAVSGGKSKSGPVIDPSDALPDGRPFDNFQEFRRLICETPEPVARCFVEHLLTFATGAGMTFADRPHIDAAVQSAASNNYGLRTLLHQALASPIFLEK